jgi:hypothetical protein
VALAGLAVEERRPARLLKVRVGYGGVGGIQRLVQPPAVILESSDFGAEATFGLRVWEECLPRLLESLAALGAKVQTRAPESPR